MTQKLGVLPHQELETLIQQQVIYADTPVTEEQVQPASLDLRLGKVAYRVRAGFMPSKHATVAEQVAGLALHELDLTKGAVLEQGAVYLVPLQESLRLPAEISGAASPKSTTGRLDIFTRLLTDHGDRFDDVKAGYEGSLWLEVAPKSFTVIARTGDKLNQLRLRYGTPMLSDSALQELNAQAPLVYGPNGDAETPHLHNGVWLTLDLESSHDGNNIIGYRARPYSGLIDLQNIAHYSLDEFWEPIYKTSQPFILNPDDFYIMISRERLRVPIGYSSEMMPFDLGAGELRVHYAGFFDPGWGCPDCGNPTGAPGVLEVRAHNVPFVVEHGQPICRMVYEHMAQEPLVPYGAQLNSNYSKQGLKLAKQFNMGK